MTDELEQLEIMLALRVENDARAGKWRTITGDLVESADLTNEHLNELIDKFSVHIPDAPAAAALPWLIAERNAREVAA